MASGHVNRVNRPNTWLHRPMLQTFKKVLANSEPSTHGGKRTWPFALSRSAFAPKRTADITRPSTTFANPSPPFHGAREDLLLLLFGGDTGRWDFVLMLSFMRVPGPRENVG